MFTFVLKMISMMTVAQVINLSNSPNAKLKVVSTIVNNNNTLSRQNLPNCFKYFFFGMNFNFFGSTQKDLSTIIMQIHATKLLNICWLNRVTQQINDCFFVNLRGAKYILIRHIRRFIMDRVIQCNKLVVHH